MTTNKPESLPLWQAHEEWHGDTLFVRLSDYERLQAEHQRLQERLQAESEQLRTDAERYRHCMRNGFPIIRWVDGKGVTWTNGVGDQVIYSSPTEAIDAAMAGDKK